MPRRPPRNGPRASAPPRQKAPPPRRTPAPHERRVPRPLAGRQGLAAAARPFRDRHGAAFGSPAEANQFTRNMVTPADGAWVFNPNGQTGTTSTLHFLFHRMFGVPLTARASAETRLQTEGGTAHQPTESRVFAALALVGEGCDPLAIFDAALRLTTLRHPSRGLMPRGRLPGRRAAPARTGGIMGGFRRGIGALLLACQAAPLAAGPCADPGFTVAAEDAALGARLCALAPRIRDDLAACGLPQTRPLAIEVAPEATHRLGSCLAWFDCDRDTIRLADPARYGALLDPASPYAALPPDVLLESALTHEMAHALAGQAAGDRPLTLVDQEYIAAALELERMAPDWRAVLIAAAPAPLPPAPGLIDIWIYGLEPRKFATNAWQHFSLAGNGCALVRRIVAGETTLATGR